MNRKLLGTKSGPAAGTLGMLVGLEKLEAPYRAKVVLVVLLAGTTQAAQLVRAMRPESVSVSIFAFANKAKFSNMQAIGDVLRWKIPKQPLGCTECLSAKGVARLSLAPDFSQVVQN